MGWDRNISRLHAALDKHNTLNPEAGCWIENDQGDTIYNPSFCGGADWCWRCGEDVKLRLNLYTPGESTHELMASDPCAEYDSLLHCAECGKMLAGWPTDYCQDEERDYFENMENINPTLETIHTVCMVLFNLQQWEVGEYHEDKKAWRKIGLRLLYKIRHAKENEHG